MTNVTVVGLGVVGEGDSLVSKPLERTTLTFEGLPGDRHGGFVIPANAHQGWFPRGTRIRNTRQLSVVSREELKAIATTLEVPQVKFEWLGANLCLEGLDRLTHLEAGTRLVFPSGATLAIDAENLACKLPGKVIQTEYPDKPELAKAFVVAAKEKRGLVGWVEREGEIAVGDTVDLWAPRNAGRKR